MTLQKYLKVRRTPELEVFARQCGVSLQAVYSWRSGRRLPAANMIKRIVYVTDGCVGMWEVLPKQLPVRVKK